MHWDFLYLKIYLLQSFFFFFLLEDKLAGYSVLIDSYFLWQLFPMIFLSYYFAIIWLSVFCLEAWWQKYCSFWVICFFFLAISTPTSLSTYLLGLYLCFHYPALNRSCSLCLNLYHSLTLANYQPILFWILHILHSIFFFWDSDGIYLLNCSIQSSIPIFLLSCSYFPSFCFIMLQRG